MIADTIKRMKSAVKRFFKPPVIVGSVQEKRRTERHGSLYGGWTVDPTLLKKDSVVYSVGVGEDITFDLAMIKRFGCVMHAMDPTPKSIEFVKEQQTPAGFKMHAWGLAAADGELTFYPPDNPDHISHTVLRRESTADRAIRVPVLRLATILGKLGHTRLDLLKMDIEGAEYDVIDDLAASNYDITQLLIEFHHRFPQVGVEKTRRAIETLNKAGYRIFSIAPNGEEYSFIRAGA